MEEMKIPEVSIVTPIYNSSKYLRQCLDAICSQTLQEIEIICVDDGSEDESVSIVQAYMQNDPRIRLYFHEHNGRGAAGARNMGLRSARGKYVLFLDSDDWFTEDLVEKAYGRAEETEADIVFYDGYWFDERGQRLHAYHNRITDFSALPNTTYFSWREIKDSVFQCSEGWAWNKLFRRKFLAENGIQFQEVFHADDAFFSYTAVMLAERISYIRDRLIYYRDGVSTGQTAQVEKSPLSAPKFVMALRKFLLDRHLYEEVKVSFLIRGVSYCRYYLDMLYSEAAFKELYQELKEDVYPKLMDEEVRTNPKTRREYIHCNKVINMNVIEYMLAEKKENTYFMSHGSNFLFPKEDILPSERIVIYGAGNCGRIYFMQILSEKHCKLAGWVDKDYQKIGFPVQGPEMLPEMEFDKIIISIENENTAAAIKQDLIAYGIPEKKIYWKKLYTVDEMMFGE